MKYFIESCGVTLLLFLAGSCFYIAATEEHIHLLFSSLIVLIGLGLSSLGIGLLIETIKKKDI